MEISFFFAYFAKKKGKKEEKWVIETKESCYEL